MHLSNPNSTKTTLCRKRNGGAPEDGAHLLCSSGTVPGVMGTCLADKQSLFHQLLKPDTFFSCLFKNSGQMLLLEKITTIHTHPQTQTTSLGFFKNDFFQILGSVPIRKCKYEEGFRMRGARSPRNRLLVMKTIVFRAFCKHRLNILALK